MSWDVSLTEPDNPVPLYDADGWDPHQGQRPEHGVAGVTVSLRKWLWTWAHGGNVRDRALAR